LQKNNELSLFKVIIFHLIPGIPVLLLTVVLTNPIFGIKLPIFPSLMIAFAICLIPTLFIILKILARKERKSIKDLMGYNEKMNIGKILLWSLPCIIFAAVIFTFGTNIESSFWTIFSWIPDWFIVNRYSLDVGNWLIPVIVLNFIIRGLLLPFIEELYFRGFLLPRMNKLGKFAPLVNAFLFLAYHLFAPWENITRTLAVLPFVYLVWFKRNLKIGIISHCSVNFLSCIALLISIV
jgi:membrane protease YdiL (CAAX protease family)